MGCSRHGDKAAEGGKVIADGGGRRVEYRVFGNCATEKDDHFVTTKIGSKKNYSTRDSHVVTHHSTNLAIHCLTRAERTGSRAFSVL
jgi:hypothetical protein